MKSINVVSLFDGMSCGQIALERAGIKVDNYFASEIDKYGQIVSKANYPNTIYLGDVRNINGKDLPKIDLIIGGSPCQSFSFAGKRKGMSTKDEQEILTLEHYLQLKSEGFEFEGQSYLFWEYMRLLNECNPQYFLLENVEMGEKWEKVLSKAIGVNGIHINSALVSAQNRKRIYWTNIGMKPSGLFGDLQSIIEQPKDKGILLKDILESEVDEKYYLSEKMLSYLESNSIKQKKNGNGFTFNPTDGNKKGSAITNPSKNRMDDNYIVASRGRNPENPKSRKSGLNTEQQLEPRSDGKTNCLTSVQKDNLVLGCDFRNDEGFRIRENGKAFTLTRGSETSGTQYNSLVLKGKSIRRLTPLECERLQTVPDNYTNHVSDSQRYKMLGNGWTVDVISYIFSYIEL
jgi:DNA (cytosine-5)-methyltransferase 3A